MDLAVRPWYLSLLLLCAALGTHPFGSAALLADTPAEELTLETSDSIAIKAWYYPVPAETKPAATVILVHDLEGSHKTVDGLARSLQQAGYAVVAPDLRAHKPSGSGGGPSEPRLLKKQDLEMIAAAAGGSLRNQSALRGEIEAVRNWIKSKSESGVLDIDKLCIIGCGLSGTLASMWTVADWNWPPVATGPQGRQVRALVLISPVWAMKGVSMSLPLSSDVLKHQVPILVLAGTADRDAGRLFDQLKRMRPRGWFEQRRELPYEVGAADKKDTSNATVFFIQRDTILSGDKLANDPEVNVSEQIKTFLSLALARPRE